MIHQVELKSEEYFKIDSINDSILSWNIDIINYIIENYDFEFIEKEDVEPENDDKILDIIQEMCFSMNFEFLDKIFHSFLLKNPRFIKDNIYQIISISFNDQSLFFTKEFFKFPGIDINFFPNGENNNSLLCEAIQSRNANAIEFLLNDPNIDILNSGSSIFLPFSFVCCSKSYKKVFELFFKHPKFDIYSVDSKYHLSGFAYCALKGCFYELQYILDYYPDYHERLSWGMFHHCFSNDYLMCTKILLKYYFNQNKLIAQEKLIKKIEANLLNEENKAKFHELINEIKNSESK